MMTLKILIYKIENAKEISTKLLYMFRAHVEETIILMNTLTTDEDVRSLKSLILLGFFEWLYMHICASGTGYT